MHALSYSSTVYLDVILRLRSMSDATVMPSGLTLRSAVAASSLYSGFASEE